MSKIKLLYYGISEVASGNGMAILQLSDESYSRMISLVCDNIMKYQIILRFKTDKLPNKLLPEVLLNILGDNVEIDRFMIDVTGVTDGEYIAMINDTLTNNVYPIRFSDAVLLSIICNISIFMDEKLFEQQSVPFTSSSSSLAIPINVLDTERLKQELQKAVAVENYELASQIKNELNRRKENC